MFYMNVKYLGATISEKPGLRERQRQERGEAILQAAFSLIIEQGYEALTMEGLAERVGISRQTLYHHFASKEEITLRAIVAMVKEGTREIEATDPALTPVERLTDITRRLLELRFSPARAAFVKAKPALLPLKSHPDYLAAFEQRAAALARIVEDAQAQGELRAGLPPRLVVQMLLGLVSDAHYEDLIATGQASSAAVVDAVVTTFFRGLRP